MRKLLAMVATLTVLLGVVSRAQVAVPNTLTAGSTIRAGDLNTNFSTLGNHALDRLSGGNISGNITVDPGITIDGVDIGATLCSSCSPVFAALTVNGAITVNGGTVGVGTITTTLGSGLVLEGIT